LEQAILLDLASKLGIGQLRELKPLFEALDQDGDGMLDDRELAEGMRLAGLPSDVAEPAAERLVRAAGGGAKVEFSRFVAALVPSCQDLLGRHLREAFDRLDADGDGFVSVDELRRLLELGPVGEREREQRRRRSGAQLAETAGPAGAATSPSAVATGSSASGRRRSHGPSVGSPRGGHSGGVGGGAGFSPSGGGAGAGAVAAGSPGNSSLSPAARAAREAFEELGGHRGKGRISFESLARHLAGP